MGNRPPSHFLQKHAENSNFQVKTDDFSFSFYHKADINSFYSIEPKPIGSIQNKKLLFYKCLIFF